jgi:hypothetical protein
MLRSAQALEQRRDAAAGSVERAREAYRARRRDCRAVERLRELKHAAWRAACGLAEQNELEEGARALRQRRTGEEAAG